MCIAWSTATDFNVNVASSRHASLAAHAIDASISCGLIAFCHHRGPSALAAGMPRPSTADRRGEEERELYASSLHDCDETEWFRRRGQSGRPAARPPAVISTQQSAAAAAAAVMRHQQYWNCALHVRIPYAQWPRKMAGLLVSCLHNLNKSPVCCFIMIHIFKLEKEAHKHFKLTVSTIVSVLTCGISLKMSWFYSLSLYVSMHVLDLDTLVNLELVHGTLYTVLDG